MNGYVILFIFMVCATLGVPLFINIGIASLLCYCYLAADYVKELSFSNTLNLLLSMFKLTETNLLIAIPLFTWAGAIMSHGEISKRLVLFVRALLGWLPGGLAIVTIGACTAFAALSGSSAVTIIAIGGMLYPALKKNKFSEEFSLGLMTSCGGIGILIPPSLPLIIFCVIASQIDPPRPQETERGQELQAIILQGSQIQSTPEEKAEKEVAREELKELAEKLQKPKIKQLFVAGVLPGFLTILLFCFYSCWKGRKIPRDPFHFPTLVRTFLRAFLGLSIVLLLLGGIYGGFATAVEVSAIAVFAALVVEIFIYRGIRLKDLPKITLEAAILSSAILMIFLLAISFKDYLVEEKIPERTFDVLQGRGWDYQDTELSEEATSNDDDDDDDDDDDTPKKRVPRLALEKARHHFVVGKHEVVSIALKATPAGGTFILKEEQAGDTGGRFEVKGSRLYFKEASFRGEARVLVCYQFSEQEKIEKPYQVEVVRPWIRDKFSFLIALNLVLLVVGCVMDIFSAILVIGPLVIPLAYQYGVHPLHLGIIFVINLEIGLATPPFGLTFLFRVLFFVKPL
jgi:tripartite ATP-independent transporter DctM subunit